MGNLLNPSRFQTGGVPLTLDDAFGGYSCYELFSAGWSSAVMYVRRSSDSAAVYLFFDSNGTITVDSLISPTSQTTPDESKLSTWASTDEIFVVDLYMQKPDDSAIDNNYRLRQNNNTYQPTIMNGGVVNVDANGTTCLLGDANSWLHQTSYTPFPHLADTEDWSIFDGANTNSSSQNMVTWSNLSRASGVDGNNSRLTGFITKVNGGTVGLVRDDTLTNNLNVQTNVPGGFVYYLTGHHHVAADKSLQTAYGDAYADSTKGGTVTYSTGYQNDGFVIMSQLFRNSELGNGDWYCNIHFDQVVPSADRTGIYNEIDAVHGTIFQ